jgi:hypothetical protein
MKISPRFGFSPFDDEDAFSLADFGRISTTYIFGHRRNLGRTMMRVADDKTQGQQTSQLLSANTSTVGTTRCNDLQVITRHI